MGEPPEKQARTIWLVSKYISPQEYGFETRLFAMAREFVKMGRQPVVITSDSNHLARFPKFDETYTHQNIDGVDTWWIRTSKYVKTVSVRRILSWLDFELKLFLMPFSRLPRPDVVVVSSLSLLTILNGLWIRSRYRCRLIFEIRDIWPLTLVEEGGYSETNPLVRLLAWVERIGYRKADLVIGTMPNLTLHVQRVAGEGIACACVPFGFDPEFFANSDPISPEIENRIPTNKFVIGYAGSMGTTNALETIVACMKEMQGDDRFFFLMAGKGDMWDKFVAETNDLRNVAFIGRVERSQVQTVLANCDLLYFAVQDSPVWQYGMSLNKLTDYMMAAKPVLASYSGYPSMLNEAGCGRFVPAGDKDALKRAIYDFAALPRERLTAMGTAGRNWLIANRRWDVLARQYLDLCDALVTKAS
jgi:glycosyltransferase involved in cell wall biosynthesis